MLGALSVGQFVYYVLGGLAAIAAFPVARFRRPPYLRSPPSRFGLALAASFGLAYAIGGMLAPNESIDPNLVVSLATPGFPPKEPLSGILWHHAVNLGVPFLLLPWFLIDGDSHPTALRC